MMVFCRQVLVVFPLGGFGVSGNAGLLPDIGFGSSTLTVLLYQTPVLPMNASPVNFRTRRKFWISILF